MKTSPCTPRIVGFLSAAFLALVFILPAGAENVIGDGGRFGVQTFDSQPLFENGKKKKKKKKTPKTKTPKQPKAPKAPKQPKAPKAPKATKAEKQKKQKKQKK